MNAPLPSVAHQRAGWHASLDLRYQATNGRSTLQFDHNGPLRVLQTLYTEGPGICHNVLVHPPGGLVAGDALHITGCVGQGAHALISTPGATRFYRSEGATATQTVRWTLDDGARLEWLPLETIAYPGCLGANHWSASLAPTAELMAWEVTALGLPDAKQPFVSGLLQQRMVIDGVWRDEGRLDAADERLMQHPMGLGGQRCIGTLVLASGSAMPATRQEALLEAVRAVLDASEAFAAATCPNDQVLVVRALGPRVEPVMALLQACWGALRPAAWGLAPVRPRIWSV
jgi:urease accessory protein